MKFTFQTNQTTFGNNLKLLLMVSILIELHDFSYVSKRKRECKKLESIVKKYENLDPVIFKYISTQ